MTYTGPNPPYPVAPLVISAWSVISKMGDKLSEKCLGIEGPEGGKISISSGMIVLS